jgi:uncharacterized protein (TIGR02171 family)
MITFFFISLVLFCSPTTSPPVVTDKMFPGMHCIHSKGRTFMLGAGDALASAADLEKPPMNCAFGYDYWIDTTEVTQKDYFAVTGRNQLPRGNQSGPGDDFPVSFVSWYDAVLYCNEKSKKHGLDTVYSYTGKDTLTSGSVIAVTGLSIDYRCGGWRLPTEAEWEFAAREGVATIPFPHLRDSAQAKEIAWFDINSSQTSHPVARLAPNAFGLYDMVGNVFEWTADWKGPYSSVPVADPIGAPGPNSYYEKTLKGGSFKHSFLYLRPSRRAGTYEAPLSTVADFIGFRCARGSIAEPHFYTPGAAVVPDNPLSAVSNPVPGFLGATKAKLALVNVTGAARRLCVVDFSSSIPVIRQFSDASDVFDPAISPDGRFVAYCSRGEGFDGPATVSIRPADSTVAAPLRLSADRAFIPRWWIDPYSRDTFLVYTNSAIDNGSDSWPSTETFLQKISGGRPTGDPLTVIAIGSFHGGISATGAYAVTGYTRCIMRDLIANRDRQLFLSPQNGKDASGSTQVCNVSISPDSAHPDRCLFLDFGSQRQVSSIVHSAYGIHEYLFIAEYGGTIVSYQKCPDGENSWDDPEWSNNASFAVASCRNSRSEAHAIYCIDLDKQTTLKVLEGVELRQPHLWIGGTNDADGVCGLSTDSLGVYSDPLLSGNQITFSYKMHFFWKMHENLEVAFVGSSQVLSGIDCAKLPGYSAFNLGMGGAGITSCTHIVRNYLLPSCPRLKLVAMSAAVYWLGYYYGDADDSWTAAIEQSKGYRYDLHHNFWRDGVPAHFDDCMAQAPFSECSNIDTLGLCIDSCAGWRGNPPDFQGGSVWDWHVTDPVYIKNFSAVDSLLRDCAAADVQVLMINFPESPWYKNTEHYSRLGPSWETGRAVTQQLKALESTHSNFHFYDAYNDGNHDYSDSEAGNWNHLCYRGAAKLTGRIDSLIRLILER